MDLIEANAILWFFEKTAPLIRRFLFNLLSCPICQENLNKIPVFKNVEEKSPDKRSGCILAFASIKSILFRIIFPKYTLK